jgi:hypothetical protein
VHGRLPLLAVGLFVVVAAITGLMFGGRFRGQPPPPAQQLVKPIAEAGVSVQLPTGWSRGGAAPLSGFHQPLWLRSSGTGVTAAVELLPAASPTLLPAGLHATGAPSVLQLRPDHMAWRYRLSRSDDVTEILFAVPTTKGIVTVGCLDVTGGAAETACRALAFSITVPGSRRIEPNQRAAFFSRVPATVAQLQAARTTGLRAFDAATQPVAQAQAADGLARAHRAAAAELAPVSAQNEPLAGETVRALGATAGAYSTLADAARARAPRPYADASTAVTGADADLRRALEKVDAAVSAATTSAKKVPAPARTPAATPTSTPAKEPATKSKPAKKPATRSTPAAASHPSASGPLTLPLLLAFGLIGGFVCAGWLTWLEKRKKRVAAGRP